MCALSSTNYLLIVRPADEPCPQTKHKIFTLWPKGAFFAAIDQAKEKMSNDDTNNNNLWSCTQAFKKEPPHIRPTFEQQCNNSQDQVVQKLSRALCRCTDRTDSSRQDGSSIDICKSNTVCVGKRTPTAAPALWSWESCLSKLIINNR